MSWLHPYPLKLRATGTVQENVWNVSQNCTIRGWGSWCLSSHFHPLQVGIASGGTNCPTASLPHAWPAGSGEEPGSHWSHRKHLCDAEAAGDFRVGSVVGWGGCISCLSLRNKRYTFSSLKQHTFMIPQFL